MRWLLAFAFCIFPGALCQSPPTKERKYDVIVQKCVMDERAKKYVPKNDMKVDQYNKSITILHGWAQLDKDIPYDAVIEILGYQQNKNGKGYSKEHSCNITRSVCDFVSTDTMVYPNLLRSSNFPASCPCRAGRYEIDNYIIDKNDLPEEISGEYWMFLITAYESKTVHSKQMFCTSLYLKFDKSGYKNDGKKKGENKKGENKKGENKKGGGGGGKGKKN